MINEQHDDYELRNQAMWQQYALPTSRHCTVIVWRDREVMKTVDWETQSSAVIQSGFLLSASQNH